MDDTRQHSIRNNLNTSIEYSRYHDGERGGCPSVVACSTSTESPILACLRAKQLRGLQPPIREEHHGPLLEVNTQHSVSTLGSNPGDYESNNEDAWNEEFGEDDEDDNSFASFNDNNEDGEDDEDHDEDRMFEIYDPILDDALLEKLIGTNSDDDDDNAANPDETNFNKENFFEEASSFEVLAIRAAAAAAAAASEDHDQGTDAVSSRAAPNEELQQQQQQQADVRGLDRHPKSHKNKKSSYNIAGANSNPIIEEEHKKRHHMEHQQYPPHGHLQSPTTAAPFNYYYQQESYEDRTAAPISDEEDEEDHDDDNSMTSLNDAFERLNDCMDRTAQSRLLVEQFAAASATMRVREQSSSSCFSSNSITSYHSAVSVLVASTTASSTIKEGRGGLNAHLSRYRSNSGANTSSSLCSSSGSVSSMGSMVIRQGPRSYTKQRAAAASTTTRRLKRGGVSKSGVAPRTIQAFSC